MKIDVDVKTKEGTNAEPFYYIIQGTLSSLSFSFPQDTGYGMTTALHCLHLGIHWAASCRLTNQLK